MIFFKKDLYAKALIELHDEVDSAIDIGKIFGTINSVWTVEILQSAYLLDVELRDKYAMIDFMIDIASKMPKRITIANGVQGNSIPPEISALVQDLYGILASVLVKKGIIKSVEHFIDYVV